MSGQLETMKIDSLIRQNEIAANIQLILHIDVGDDQQHWDVTPEWKNVGKTDARNVRGWGNIHEFSFGEKARDSDFLTNDTGLEMSNQDVMIAEDRVYHPTRIVTIQKAWEYIYGMSASVVYGYLEYRDIFENEYTIRYCRLLNFVSSGRQINVTLSIKLELPCERRTKKEHK